VSLQSHLTVTMSDHMAPQAHEWRPTPRPGVSALPLDEELVLYHPESRESFALNQTGAQVWSLCDGEHTIDSIAQEISSRHAISHEQALSDVRDLIHDLQQSDLLDAR
jgi:hypothetical protein